MNQDVSESIQIPEILYPKRDIIFRRLFGVEKNMTILKSFIQAILDLSDEDVQDLQIKDPHLLLGTKEDKLSILDLKLTLSSGTIAHVEIQQANRADMIHRIVYYNSRLITEQVQSGDDMYFFHRVISIVITSFDLIPHKSKYFSRSRLLDLEDYQECHDLFEYVTINLSRLPNETDNSKRWEWLRFLNTENKEEFEQMKTRFNDPEIVNAVKELEKISQNKEARAEYFQREKALRDYISMFSVKYYEGRETGIDIGRSEGIDIGRTEGIDIGRSEGIEAERYETAVKLFKNGVDRSIIREVTCFNDEKLDKIENALHNDSINK